MDIGGFQKRMDDALDEVKHLLVQSGYYDNLTLENIGCDRDDPDDVQLYAQRSLCIRYQGFAALAAKQWNPPL